MEWLNKIVETITPVHLKKRLDEEREVDFSYYTRRWGGSGRICSSSAGNGVFPCAMCEQCAEF